MIELAKILVSGVDTRVIELEPIPEKIYGATVRFIFDDPMWDGLIRNAVFAGSRTVSVLNVGDTAEIPMEAVSRHGPTLRVGICGTAADGKVVIPTLYANLGPIRPAADPGADPSADPALPVWAQIQAQIGDLNKLDTANRDSLVAAINEVMRKGGGSADPAEIEALVQEYLEKNPPEPGEPGEDGGYYTPGVTQPDDKTVQFAFAPSKPGMPAVEPVRVRLPVPDSGGNVDYGEENAGKLLYVGADGTATPIALGDGLEITGGASKNLAKAEWVDKYVHNTDGSCMPASGKNFAMLKDKIDVVPGETYTCSFSAMGGVTWVTAYVAEYKTNDEYVSTTSQGNVFSAKKFTFTVGEATAKIIVYFYNSGDILWENLIPVNFMMEVGDTATEYEPYSNTERSISATGGILGGDTEEEKKQVRESINAIGYGVQKSKNIADIEWKQGGIAAGEWRDSVSNHNAGSDKYIPVESGVTYTLSCSGITIGSANLYVTRYDADKNFIDYTRYGFGGTMLSAVCAMTGNTAFIRVHIYHDDTSVVWSDRIPQHFQIELGSTATAYVSPEDTYGLDNGVNEILKPVVTEQAFENAMLNQVSNTVRTIAHRGDPVYAPQCTAPAYIVARKRGHSVMENDLMLTDDSHFVMWHDTTLSRLGNLVDINGYHLYTDGTTYYFVNPSNNTVYTYETDYVTSGVALSALTRCAGASYGANSTYGAIGLPFDILRRIDFGAWFDEKYKGTQILTFEEWIMLCKQLGCEAYVDHKLPYAQITDEIVTEMANIVKKCGMGEFTSWLGIGDIARINTLRAIIPNARVGTLNHPNSNTIETYKSVNTGRGFFFNGNAASGMTAEVIQLGLNAGFDVEVWYVEYGNATPETVFDTIRTAVSYGVTGITADHYRVDEAFKHLLERY